MGRSVKKGPYVQEVLYKRVKAMNDAGEKKVLKTWSRASTIFPEFVGHTFATLILILFGGLSLWVYIILWLIVPKAPKRLTE